MSSQMFQFQKHNVIFRVLNFAWSLFTNGIGMKLNRNLCKLNINFACVKLSIIMIFIITYTVVFLFRFMYLEEIIIDVNNNNIIIIVYSPGFLQDTLESVMSN